MQCAGFMSGRGKGCYIGSALRGTGVDNQIAWADRELPTTANLLDAQLLIGRLLIAHKDVQPNPHNLVDFLFMFCPRLLSVSSYYALRGVHWTFTVQLQPLGLAWSCMACEFKDMLCARHHKDERRQIKTIPSFFNPSLKVHGDVKYDYTWSSNDDLSGSENDEVFRFKPLISTNLSVPMLRFSTPEPSSTSMKYKTRGLCPRYFKRKCNHGKACVFSHSIAAWKAKKKKDKELQKEFQRQKKEQREQRARGRGRGRGRARSRGGVLAISRY